MMRSDVISAVEQAVGEITQQPVAGLDEGSRLFEDLHMDSTSVLELLMTLEDSVGISVDPEELNMDDLRSVGSLTDYVLAQRVSSDA